MTRAEGYDEIRKVIIGYSRNGRVEVDTSMLLELLGNLEEHEVALAAAGVENGELKARIISLHARGER